MSTASCNAALPRWIATPYMQLIFRGNPVFIFEKNMLLECLVVTFPPAQFSATRSNALPLSLVLVPGGTYSIEALEVEQSESEREYFFDEVKIEARQPETRSGYNKESREHDRTKRYSLPLQQ